MSGQALAEVLGEHVTYHIEGMGQFFCACDQETDIPWRTFTREAHSLHLAAAVAAWLGERLAGAREDVAEAFDERDECEHERDVDAWGWECQPCSADAALDVVRRALGIEVRG